MSLNTKTQNRSYLFGRLLAVADKAESRTYEKEDGGRWTNAKRYWSVYSKQPAKTWKTIEDNLVPYLMKLKPGESKKYQQLIIDIGAQFNDNEFSNQPLTENYLLGYYCQMSELKFKDSSVTNANAGNPSINNENISAEGDNEDE